MIEMIDLTKQYRDLIAVDHLTMTIAQGDCFGFIGPNGAGKTTTIQMLSTLLQPTSGSIKIGGCDIIRDPAGAKTLIGYMPDYFGLYDEMKVQEYLEFFCRCYGLKGQAAHDTVNDVLALTDLEVKRDAHVKALSRGMQQRLCLAKTLLHNPPVLLLDEPASGLDPRARIEFRELMKELRAMGKTIFISSHILSELGDFCTSVGIMEKGRLLISGPIHEIADRLRTTRLIKLKLLKEEDAPKAEQFLRTYPTIQSVSRRDGMMELEHTGSLEDLVELIQAIVHERIPFIGLHEEIRHLEDIFLKVTKGEVS